MDGNYEVSINIKVVKGEEFEEDSYRWEILKNKLRDACIQEARKSQPENISQEFVKNVLRSKVEQCEAGSGRNYLNSSDKWVLKNKLYDLYEEYAPLLEIKKKRFRDEVESQSIDGKYATDNRSLKIETWYFLTPTEATEHLLFDKYLESCSFVKGGSYSDSDVEDLKKLVSLPKELIVSGIKRKTHQYKVLEIEREFTMVMKHLIENDYIQRSKNPYELIPSLKKDMELCHVSDERLKSCLLKYTILLNNVPRSSLADYRKFFERKLLQKIDEEYERGCQELKQLWKITENDGVVYYTAFKNLYWKQEKVEHLEHMMVQRIDDFFGSLSEDVKQHFEHMMLKIKDHCGERLPQGIKQSWNTWEVHGPSFYTASKNLYWKHGKLEIWYFLTEEEKKRLLLFEKYINSSPDSDCSLKTIENLARRFFLPKDLIMAGIERKINLSKVLEKNRDVYDVVKFFLKNVNALLECSLCELLRELKKESRFSPFDDDIFTKALKVYNYSHTSSYFSIRRMKDQLTMQEITDEHEKKCKRIKKKKLREIDGKDEFCYGKFSNRTSETLEIMEDSIRQQSCKQSRGGSEDSRLSKRCRTCGDYLEEQNVDRASLFEIDARQKDIDDLNWRLLFSYKELALQLSILHPFCPSLSGQSLNE